MVLVTCPGAFRMLMQKSCQKTSYRELEQRSCQETSYGDLVQRSCQETSYRDLANRALIDIMYRDLARRPLIEIFYRDLVNRAEVLLGVSFKIYSWNIDLTLMDRKVIDVSRGPLQKSSVEISYRHLVQIPIHRDLAQQLLRRTCQGDLAHNLLQRSSQRELAESYLASLLFTARVALALLACSH